MRTRAASLALVLLVVAAGGCSTYVDRNARLRDDLATRDYDAALKVIDEAERGPDRLLTLLERGLVLHYADRWEESNTAFEAAEELSAELYTRSVSQAVVSLVTNDAAVDYRAAPYEMALVPYFRALNYIGLNRRDAALVEARKAELRLRDLAEVERALARDDEDVQDPAVSLDDHALLHWFRGMLHEWGGETNDAFLAYRRAALAFRDTGPALGLATPAALGGDLARTAAALGFADELAEVRRACPALTVPDAAPAADTGRVVLFLELGWAPRLESVAADVPIFKNEVRDDRAVMVRHLGTRYRTGWRSEAEIAYWLRFALPEMVDEAPRVTGARVSAGLPGSHARAVLADDVAARAELRFQENQGAVVLRTIGRALAKWLATEKAEDQGKLAGLLMNLLGAATEHADTRGWLTLPHGIAVARLELPPGVHDLRVELTDAADRTVETRTIEGVTVRPGGWTFLSRRVF
ncbi:MAG TPA: hypothetical protein P5571_04190 [Candidatus Krumholzibacteria bacterium]|nr:hypothetical protein [Candidatus Krumholzibacteria bacterium]HRX50539.1 hypothetical protein [Candidatus Krumholzibacteria bacterium]